MFTIKLFVFSMLLTLVGIGSAEASSKVPTLSQKTAAEIQVGLNFVPVSNRQSPSKTIYVCSVMRGMSYGAALVGLQSIAISLPSMATVAGAPVAAVAAGAGAISAGISIAMMIVNDRLCTWERISR